MVGKERFSAVVVADMFGFASGEMVNAILEMQDQYKKLLKNVQINVC